jgi:dTDP-4-dehydrorhamnose 3,5-epimerase
MQARELSINGAWEFTPRSFGDDRGIFLEWFKADVVAEAIGHPFTLVQANHSVSRRGVVRGIHYAAVPPSQAKYVYCPQGAALDVIVDIRVGSPTYGRWEGVRLDDEQHHAVYLAEGLGHAFMALTDDATVVYLCSEGYAPGREHGINPLDPELGITWPSDVEPLLSEKDAQAPSLAEARDQGLLPTYDDCRRFSAQLRARDV